MIDMVVIDHMGTKMHASIPIEVMRVMQFDLLEENVYYIRNFGVLLNNDPVKVCEHPFKLMLLRRTEVVLAENDMGVSVGFTLVTKLNDIRSTEDITYTVDMVGVLTSVTSEREYVRVGEVKTFVSLELTDLTGKVECLLFDESADEVMEYIRLHGKSRPTVVVQFARVTSIPGYLFGDRVVVDHLTATRVLFNSGLAESIEFTNRMAILGKYLDGYLEVFHDRANVVALKDEFVCMHARRKIIELITTRKAGLYIVWGKIVNVLVDTPWWYYACTCGSFMATDPGLFFCPACKKWVAVVTPRYRLKVNVYDGHARVNLSLEDEFVSMLMGQSCQDLLTELPDPSRKVFPKQLSCLVGKNMLFKLEKSFCSTRGAEDFIKVRKIYLDMDIVKLFLEKENLVVPVQGQAGMDYIPIVNWSNNLGEGSGRPPQISDPNIVYKGHAMRRHAMKMQPIRKASPRGSLDLDYGMTSAAMKRVKGMQIFPKSVVRPAGTEVNGDRDEQTKSRPNP